MGRSFGGETNISRASEESVCFRRTYIGRGGGERSGVEGPDEPRELVRSGFYASQDADIGPHDDGDYYTWTLDEVRAALPEDEFRVAVLHYNVNERGEMHHDPRRNVLFIEKDPDAIALIAGLPEEQVRALLASAKQRLLAARDRRPTPFIDRTIYAGWNGMAISACFEVFKGLLVTEARAMALRALDP